MPMNSSSATTIMAGLIAGTMILVKIRICPAPSMVAASSSSRGMERINCRIRKMLNAPPPQKYGRINGQNVSTRCSPLLHMM